MALETQTIPLVFQQGVDTKTNEKVLPAGKLRGLENADMDKPGKFKHRPGKEELSTDVLGGTSLSNPKKLATFKDELLQFANSRLYSYSESNDAWVDRGPVAAVSVESKTLIRNTATQSHPDCATLLGITVYAWEDSRGGIRATVIDQETGLPIQSDVEISSSGSRPRVSAGAAYLYIHYADSGNTFKVRRLAPGSPLTFDAAVTLSSDMNGTNPNFDISKIGSSLVFCYETTGNIVKTGYLKADGDIAGVSDGFPDPVDSAESGSGAVAICGLLENGANDKIYVFYHNTTDGLNCIVYSVDLDDDSVVEVDPITTQVNQITAVVLDDKAYVFYEVNAAQTYNRYIKSDTVDISATVGSGGGGSTFILSLGLSGKAFLGPNDDVNVVAIHESTFQPTYFTLQRVSATRAFVVNTFAKDEAGGLHSKRSQLSSVRELGESQYLFPSRIKTRLVSENSDIFGIVGLQSTVFDFDSSGIFETQELGDNLHITGGVLQNYDGRSATEHGFFLFPENLSNAITTTTGDLEAGARQYCAVYEWTDNQGNIHRSAPSIPIEVTNAADDKNTLTIPTLRITEKKAAANRSEVSIALYRTVVDGEIFYRVNSVTSPTANTTTSDTITIEDNVTDAAIVSNEILYITGGEVDNIQPDSSSIIGEYNDRLILGAEDANLVQYSKKRVKNLGLSFNDDFTFRADQGGGKLFAIKRLDDKLALFKEQKILIQIGQGPNPTGADNDFRTPEALPSDVGTTSPQSVVEYPGGLIFKSNKGFWRLTRGLQADYIGKEVEEFNSNTVSGAVLMKDKNQVRFTHSDGPTLVYDYFAEQWGTFTNEECLSSVVWQGSYCILRDDGTVLKESSTTWLDAGAWQPMKIESGWISFAGLNGYKRVYEMLIECAKRSEHQLRIRLYYNYQPDVFQTFIFDTEEKLGSGDGFGEDEYFGRAAFYGGEDGRYTVSIQPKLQKCSAIKFVIEDLNADSLDGAGVETTGISFVVGVKKGLRKMGGSQSAESQ
jgi:Tfp pilus assembly protein PilX